LIILLVSTAVICITSCTHKPGVVSPPTSDGNYPAEVAKILVSKCTYSGCHNQASYQNAAGLLLDTWEHLFKGSVSGAEVVAYSTAYSPLLYYCNTDTTLGLIVKVPGHPPTDTPLTHAEYITLYNWIAKGAPDKNGNIPFASDPDTRQKWYCSIAGCNLIAVIDVKSRVIMRYIPVGVGSDKSLHDFEISADGRYGYMSFYNGSYVQKIDTRSDTVVGSVNIGGLAIGGSGNWSVVSLSPQDTAIMVTGWIAAGCIVNINATNMTVNARLSVDALKGNTDLFPYPHGIASNATYDTFYATLQTDVIKYAFNSLGVISYHKNISASGSPHQVEMSPDFSKYFVTCPDQVNPAANTVRVYDAHTDTLLKSIAVGYIPQEMAVSESKGYLFVTCMEDAANPRRGSRGSVYVINYNTLDVVSILYGDFFQPHDIAIDEVNGLVFIPSRNVSTDGPAPHHATACAGRPGWYTIYDLNTLTPLDNKRYDTPVDPYVCAIRFK
jgi:DNA-binding beta-propeller fold protein YncE